MVGNDSIVKQKTADNLVDEDFIADAASEDDSTTDGLVEDSTIDVPM